MMRVLLATIVGNKNPQFRVHLRLFQSCATPPHLLDNLPHWGEHFDKHFDLHLWCKLLSKCSPQWGDCPTNGKELHTTELFTFASMVRVLTSGQDEQLHASQTKILENETSGRACLFDVHCEVS